MGLKHAYVNPIADGVDATLVRPSDFNADHVGFPLLATYEADLTAIRLSDFGSRATLAGSWGTAIVGGAWSLTGDSGTGQVSAPEGFLKTGSTAAIAVPHQAPILEGKIRSVAIPGGGVFDEIWFGFFCGVSPVFSTAEYGVRLKIGVDSTGAMSWAMNVVTSTGSMSGQYPFPAQPTGVTMLFFTYYSFRVAMTRDAVMGKIWLSTDAEPDWQFHVAVKDAIASTGLSGPLKGDDLEGRYLYITPTRSAGSTPYRFSELRIRDGARTNGTFDITGLSGLTAGKSVLVFQVPGAYTGKGDRQDEAEVGLVTATGYVVDATTIRVFWRSEEPMAGNVNFAYAVTA